MIAGCAPIVIGAAAGTATVAADRRTTGEQVEDKAIQVKIADKLNAMFDPNNSRYNVVSHDGRVLLMGDVPNEALKQQAEAAARTVENIKEIHNLLRVGAPTPLSVRSNDTWLTTKINTEFIATKGIPTRTITITTERGVVYLLGKVTEAEAQRAAQVASGISGVNKVVTLFDIISAPGVAAPAGAAPAASAPAASNNAETRPVQ
jgi:osmotically-inducible protein OsmY